MVNFIDSIMAQNGKILRPNRFKVTLYFPDVIVAQIAVLKSTVFALSTSVPSKETGIIEIPAYGGTPIKVPGDVTVPDWSCTFQADPDMTIYRALQRWKEFCSSTITGLRANDLVLFGGAEVQQMDGLNQTVQTWELVKIFPTSIGELALSKEDKDSYLQFDSSFACNDIITDLV